MVAAAYYPPGFFCWNELGTRGAESAKRFYGQLFSWETQDVPMGPEGTYTLIKIDGKDIAGLYEMTGAHFEGVPPHWLSYIAVANADASAKQAAALGGTVLSAPFDVPNVGRMAVIKDPQGAVFAIFQAGAHPGAARLGLLPGAFCWNELATTDTSSAMNFYRKLFGWEAKTDTSSMPYTEFIMQGTPGAGMLQIGPDWGNVPPNWMPYVAVADCDAGARKAASLGGKVIRAPTDIPNVGRFAVLGDPQGAVFAIIKLSAPA